MVAKITTPKSIEATLNYNEKKVQNGNAICLHAANYLNEAKYMNFYQKLNGFERLNSLNERATTKTLHVSLNFDPSEKLSNNKLIDIAAAYMQNIGFGEQPFLIYKHEDAGHPHIHLVSTTIKKDGSRISTHNIGKNQSGKARKEIEELFGLIKAQKQQKIIMAGISPINVDKAVYGKTETKRSISNVVTTIFNQYKFSSLPEFNAALKQFNVVADRGKEEGRIFKNRGLVYRILDSGGNKVGVPIKASSIGYKPTLDNLEKKFITSEAFKESLKHRTKEAIDGALKTLSPSLKNLVNDLMQKNIYTVLRHNAEGRLYGITFVDNKNKIVLNGSDLGKGYSASGLQSRLNGNMNELIQNIKIEDSSPGKDGNKVQLQNQKENRITHSMKKDSLIDLLFSAREEQAYMPNALLQKRRKKKKKNTNT